VKTKLGLFALLWLCAGLRAAEPSTQPPNQQPIQPSIPTVQQILPQSWTVGETARVSIWGQHLDRVRSLQFDTDALSGAVLASTFTTATVQISIARDAKPGLHSVHLVTPRGISNVFHFRVTGWKSVLEKEPNSRLEQAQPVSVETSINGMILDTNDSDFYSFHAREGEELAFNIFLGRNGYATGGEVGNVTLTLLDSKGRTIDSNFSRFIWDPYLRQTFKKEGDYFIVVDHARLAVTCFVNNCENRRLGESYQLTIGRSPMLWSVWPPAGSRGSSIDATLAADFLQPGTPLSVSGTGVAAKIVGADEKAPGRFKISVTVDAGTEAGLRFVTVPDSSGNLAPLSFLVFDESLQVESEPNDTLDKSPVLKTPSVLLGRIDHPADVDSFQFQANEGEALVFEVAARALGSEILDPHVAVLSVDGDIVSINDDAPSFTNPKNRDSKLEMKIPFAPNCAKRSDRFFVQVRDTSKHSGESSFYILNLRKQTPAFQLGLASERIFLQRGGSTQIPVTVRRMEGFVDEVSVSVQGLPQGAKAKPLVIKATETAGKLELTAADDVNQTISRIDIVGQAQVEGKKLVGRAVWPDPMMGDGFGYVQTIPEPLQLCIVDKMLFALNQIEPDRNISGGRTVLSLGRGGKADLLVRIQRQPNFAAALDFAVEGLPKGLVLEGTELTDENKIARLVVKAADGTIALGEYPIAVTGSAGSESGPRTEATQTFFLRIEK